MNATIRPGRPAPLGATPGHWTLLHVPGFSSEAASIDKVRARLVRKFSHVPKIKFLAP